jgi:2-octaprenyl-6-methoxyphenol hydroxylase
MHDIAIVGAGPIGCTLALALADADLDIVALDARQQGTAPRGDRSLALSHGSRLILERLGVWAPLAAAPGAVTPIAVVDVSQARGFGVTRLTAADAGVPALGYVVSYVALQRTLDEAVARAGVPVRYGVSVTAIDGTGAHAALGCEGAGEPLLARLAVVADGEGAVIGGMSRKHHDYGQVAVVAKVWMDAPHGGVAYERFTEEGPVALLPEHGCYGLVWTMAPARAEAAMQWSDEAFLAELAAHFGARVRGFSKVSQRRRFPLVLDYAQRPAALRAIAIGNAAQTLHPVAGQGFNLGLRDAWELSRAIVGGERAALGTAAMLDRYLAGRRPDRLAGIAFTHSLVRLFDGRLPFGKWPRGIALAMLDAALPVKRAFARAMLNGLR